MSTRACISFLEENPRVRYSAYIHSDGYPKGVEPRIRAALQRAWELPRYEADDFAAAFIAANKLIGGGIRISRGHSTHGDLEYRYEVYSRDDTRKMQFGHGERKTLCVRAFKIDGTKRFIAGATEVPNWKPIYDGPFESFKDFVETDFVES